jgi:putative DNA primase/helicase
MKDDPNKDAPGGVNRQAQKQQSDSDVSKDNAKLTVDGSPGKAPLRALPPVLTPLMALPHWVLWRWKKKIDEKTGAVKWTKPPHQTDGRHAKNNDPSTWTDYVTATQAYEAGDFAGIGFAILGSGFAAFDIDDCRDPRTGVIDPWAMELVTRANSYTEITVSGTGLRIIGRGEGAEICRKQPVPANGVSVETFRNCARYIVMTGDALPGTPAELNNIDAVIDATVSALDSPVVQQKAAAQAEHRGAQFMATAAAAKLRGMTLDETEAVLRDHPEGAASKFLEGRDRLHEELERCWAKIGDLRAEDTLAEVFVLAHAPHMRYVALWGRWMRYHEGCWQRESTLLAFDLAREICRKAAAGCNKLSEAKTLRSAKTIAAVERIPRADRRIAATIDQWDTDPWLLNTPAGVVDLRTGKMRLHRADDYLTKMTSVGPGGDCLNWKAHLELIMNGDKELIAYLQRAFGYSLTGITREHALFFAYGTGANGKGTTYDTVAKILGSYARVAPMKTFTATKIDEHPTELAMLRGARLVMANETEEGRSWAESRIKELTGGGRVTARFMRQDYFEYDPRFKLWFSGNHKPALRSVDEANRRRFNLLPFTVTIAKDKRDPKFAEDKLTAELPGILAWMIEGCLEWQRNGLRPPQAVTQATDEYLEAQDAIKRWFMEECVADRQAPGLFTAELYAGWKRWAAETGEYPISQRQFSQKLEEKSADLDIRKENDLRRDDKHGKGFSGVRWRNTNNKSSGVDSASGEGLPL